MTSDPDIEAFKKDEGAGGQDNINRYKDKEDKTGHVDI